MWQEIAIYIIGILTILYIIRNLYQFFLIYTKPQEDKCIHCSGCAIKKRFLSKS